MCLFREYQSLRSLQFSVNQINMDCKILEHSNIYTHVSERLKMMM